MVEVKIMSTKDGFSEPLLKSIVDDFKKNTEDKFLTRGKSKAQCRVTKLVFEDGFLIATLDKTPKELKEIDG